jgi:hypothetical protein
VNCVEYRERGNWGFNLQIFKLKKLGISKNIKVEEKRGKESNLVLIPKKNLSRKRKRQNQ